MNAIQFMHFPLSNRRTKTETELHLMDLHAKNSPLFLPDPDATSDHDKNTGRFLALKFKQRNSVHVLICLITEGKTHEPNCIWWIHMLKIHHYFYLM